MLPSDFRKHDSEYVLDSCSEMLTSILSSLGLVAPTSRAATTARCENPGALTIEIHSAKSRCRFWKLQSREGFYSNAQQCALHIAWGSQFDSTNCNDPLLYL